MKVYILIQRPDIESHNIVGAFKGKRSLNKFVKEHNIDLNNKTMFDFYEVKEVKLI